MSKTTCAHVIAFAAAVLIVVQAPHATSGEADATMSYEQEMKEWKAYRVKRLSNKEGYLALTGLFWIMEDGRYSFGADASNDFVFPGRDVPARIGVYELKGGVITLELEPGIELTENGDPFPGGRVYHDRDEERTLLARGTLTWWIIKRGDRHAIRLSDSESPYLKHFDGKVDRYDTAIDWRVDGRLEKYNPPKFIDFVDVNGIVSRELCAGALVFESGGKEYRLDGVLEGDSYFVIFGDATNGYATYGGGRFLYVDAADESGRVTIDFNKAYTPWCAYTNYTTCQLPPQQNRLSIEVTAGEKDYKNKLE